MSVPEWSDLLAFSPLNAFAERGLVLAVGLGPLDAGVGCDVTVFGSNVVGGSFGSSCKVSWKGRWANVASVSDSIFAV
jgi:hypothetical protein